MRTLKYVIDHSIHPLIFFLIMSVSSFAKTENTIPQILTNSPYQNYQSIYQNFFKTRDEQMNSEDNATLWNKALQQKPNDLLIKSYWASSITMIARDSFMPWNKIKYVEEAIRIFDQVDHALEEPQLESTWLNTPGFASNALFDIWYVQAQTLMAIPDSIFKTHARGRALLNKIRNHPKFEKTSDPFKKSVNKFAQKHLNS